MDWQAAAIRIIRLLLTHPELEAHYKDADKLQELNRLIEAVVFLADSRRQYEIYMEGRKDG